ncbi:protein kinase [Gemmatimonadota bacterium]
MGEVWLAEDIRLERKVALKFFPAGVDPSDEEQARFLREAQAASALDHINICTIYEVGETEEGTSFIAMAYCEGETLKEKIARGPLPLDEALMITRQIGEGLARAHREGIIHRDIKPSNVLITIDGVVKIVDFGLAAISGATKLTKTGTSMGTVAYAAPEQLLGEEVDHRADIWSLGIVLYEMITGRLPFEAEHEQGVVAQILQIEPEPITALRSRIPIELELTVSKAIRKAPGERYQHIDDLVVDLKSAFDAGPVHATQSTGSFIDRMPRAWKRWPGLAVTLVVIISVGIGLLITIPSRTKQNTKWIVHDFEYTGPEEYQHFSAAIPYQIRSTLLSVSGVDVLGSTDDSQIIDYQLSGRIVVSRDEAGSLNTTIYPQLMHVSDRHIIPLPSTPLSATGSEIISLESELVQGITETLDMVIQTSLQSGYQRNPTNDLEAYRYYSAGLAYDMSYFSSDNLRSAIAAYERAVELDPSFAIAWARLAQARMFLFWRSGTPEMPSMAQADIGHAFALNPNLPEAYVARAYYNYYWHDDFREALNDLRRARQKGQRSVLLYRAIGLAHRRLGNLKRAAHYFEEARGLDPLNSRILYALAQTYAYLGKFEESVHTYETLLGIDLQFESGYPELAFTHLLWNGDKSSARSAIDQMPADLFSRFYNSASYQRRILVRSLEGLAFDLPTDRSRYRRDGYFHYLQAEKAARQGDNALALALYDSARVAYEHDLNRGIPTAQKPQQRANLYFRLGIACAGSMNKEDAVEFGLRAVAELPVSNYFLSGNNMLMYLAEIYVLVEEYENAIEQLGQVLKNKGCSPGLLMSDPRWEPLHTYPRFQRLLRKYD